MCGPLVRAILDGTKTQTRRIVKPVRGYEHHNVCRPDLAADEHAVWWHGEFQTVGCMQECPYGQPGDRLWVRETFAIVPRTAYRCSEGVQQTLRPDDDHDAAIYREGWTRSRGGFRWRPSIHMPRWASRITLEVTGVRVELLQDINAEDAWREGVACSPDVDPVHGYRELWEQLHGPHAWDANPWVWVVSFVRVKP
jgi:hypothetical protein